MSGTLVRTISALSAANYGVNIQEIQPAGAVQGVGSNVVAIVGEFPWGPADEVTTISSPEELFETFAPREFENLDDFPALKAFLGKRFPVISIVRVGATGQATSAKTFVDDLAADSVDVTAKHPGGSGDLISAAWSVNADDADARDLTIAIGSTYSRTYLAVATTTPLAIVDPGDPFVDVVANGSFVDVPVVIAATLLTGGSDGNAVALDYTGSIASDKGIRKFYGENVAVGVLFVAECPTSLLDVVNTAIEAYAVEANKGVAVLCTVAAQSKTDALTYIVDYRDDRLSYHWPRVKIANAFDPDQPVVVVDGNAFAASVISQVDPEVSPGGPRRSEFLNGILDLEDNSATDSDLNALNAAGIAPWFNVTGRGMIIRRGITTSLVVGQTRIARRRMTDFILNSIASRLQDFIEEPLDLTLSPPALGVVTGPEIGEINAFLEGLQDANRIGIFPDQEVGFNVDPFSANTQSAIDAGIWKILAAVKLLSAQDVVILQGEIGEFVTVTEQ